MATGYGSYISGDWRGVVVATVANTSETVCTVTVVGKCESVYATASYMDGRVTQNSSGGYSDWTDWFRITPGNTTTFLTKSFTISRGTAAKTVTCYAQSRSSSGSTWGQQTSTASVNVTIPAMTSYPIAYNENKPSGAGAITNMPSNQTKWHGTALTLASTVPSLNQYYFTGWNTKADGSGTSYAAGASYTTNAAATLYAQWELAYSYPTISSASVIRTNSSGVAANEGTCAKVSFSWSVDSTADGGKNKGKKAVVSYKLKSASSYTTASTTNLSTTSGTLNIILDNTSHTLFATDLSYDIEITVTDTHGGSQSSYLTLSQAFFTVDFLSGGRGVAIGKAASVDGLLDIGLDVNIDGSLTFNSSNGSYGSAQDVSSYNSASNRYTFPSDGLLRVESSFRASSYALAHVYNADGTELFIIEESSAKTEMMGNQSNCVPVFAGMSAYFERNSSVPYGSMYFIPRIDDIGVVVSERHVYERDVLYDNSEGDEGTITLSASAANYDHMVIYFTNRSVCSSVEVYKPNGKNANLFIGGTTQAGGVLWPLGRDISINGTAITTRDSVRYYGAQSATSTGYTLQKANVMYIYRVEAW